MLYPDDFIEKQFCFISTIGGEKISLKNSNIAIYDKDGNLKHQSSCYRLLAIFVIGHISITTCLIEKAKKFGFVIILMTSGFRPYQVIGAMAEANVELRKNQYLYCDFDCAKKLIANKISNQRNLLMSIRNKSESQLQAIQNIDNYVNNLLSANSIRQIMGIEGSVARIYFKSFFDNVNWNGRFPRVKTDMINALLDIGYTLLFNFIDALLSIFGFDRYCGFCHTQFYMRKSLTCDIVEPFRCIIDKQIKKIYKSRSIQRRRF